MSLPRLVSPMFVAVSLLLSSPVHGATIEQRIENCKAVYWEVWELRAKGKDSTANGLHARVRHDGCLEPPIDQHLCPLLDQQETLREADGDPGLAGVIRAQKQRLRCPR